MLIPMIRVQAAVGQGGLHYGRIGDDEGTSWMYDCGSYSRRCYFEREVDYLRSLSPPIRAPRPTLDVLYLSHFHEDHVNRLVLIAATFDVKRVVIPRTSALERLHVFLTWSHTPYTPAGHQRLGAALAANPASVLHDLFPDADVDEVTPEEQPPPPRDGDLPPDEPPPDEGHSDARRWPGSPRPVTTAIRAPHGVTHIAAARGPWSRSTPIWDLIPFALPTMLTVYGQVEADLLTKFPTFTAAQLTALLGNPSALLNWLAAAATRRKVQDAYADAMRRNSLGANQNLTSLVLLSAPADRNNLCVHPVGSPVDRRSGWLHTGDVDVPVGSSHEAALSAFVAQHAHRLQWYSLPHHGADSSWGANACAAAGPAVVPV
ncbi:hypothetical protein, partial [Propionibacterium freudenreichii]